MENSLRKIKTHKNIDCKHDNTKNEQYNDLKQGSDKIGFRRHSID